MNVRSAVLLAAAGILAPSAALAQSAAAYPSKLVRLVVPFVPGGGTDLIARMTAQGLGTAWGKPVIVENRPGANSLLGVEYVVKAPPDGHTMLIGSPSSYSLNPFMYQDKEKLSFDLARDLAPVTMLGSLPLIFTVHPTMQVRSIRELIALAKSRPGDLNYGTSSIAFYVIFEAFSQKAGIRMTRISYKGSGPAIQAQLSGEVPVLILDSPSALPHIKSGKIVPIAITSAQRAPYLPDIQTLAEAGLPGAAQTLWVGLFTRSGTPREVIGRIQAEAARVMLAPELRERLAGVGTEPVGSTPEAFAEHLRTELANYGPVIRDLNIQMQ